MRTEGKRPKEGVEKMASFRQVLSSECLFKKHPQGKSLTSSAKRIVVNVFAKLWEQNPNGSANCAATKTAELTGVSRKSVYACRKELKVNGCLRTPGKKRPKAVGTRTRLVRYDEFTLCAVRKKVHEMFRRNEIPTIKKVMAVINSDDDLPNMCHTTVHRLMKDLGFVYAKPGRNSALIERDDIILWRRRYLRTIRQYRQEGRRIYFTDETWVNSGHTKSKIYQDTTVKTTHQAFLAGLTTGLKTPSGKGERLIITHAGSEDGFVNGALEVFRSKKKGDYHDEMDGPHYERWFTEKFLPNIEPNSVIVIDNASYHSVRQESIPNNSAKKCVIQGWLTSKGVSWSPDMVKAELLNEVARVKPLYERYRIDEIATLHGHTVLRLPPYHCELNPIELIWSQVKGHVAANNTTFKMADIERLTMEGFKKVTSESWKKCVDHVRGEEEKMWNLDGQSDIIIDSLRFDINTGTTDSGSETDDTNSSSLSGIEEL